MSIFNKVIVLTVNPNIYLAHFIKSIIFIKARECNNFQFIFFANLKASIILLDFPLDETNIKISSFLAK